MHSSFRGYCTLALAGLLAAGCNETDKTAREARRDAAEASEGAAQGEDGGAADCIENPSTHEELINACTDAEKIEKQPTLPLLLSDGGLPPLP